MPEFTPPQRATGDFPPRAMSAVTVAERVYSEESAL